MLLHALLLLLLLSFVTAQQRSKLCRAPQPLLPLPACTKQCLVGEQMVLDATCADDLEGICRLSDTVPIHFDNFGPCILNACPDVVDRRTYVNMFMAACKGTDEFHVSRGPGSFSYKDLLNGTPSGSAATSTADSTSRTVSVSTKTRMETPIVISMEPTATPVSPTDTHSEVYSISTSTLSSETERSTDAPSEPPPPAASTPPSSADEDTTESPVETQPLYNIGPAEPTSDGQESGTVHTHVTMTAKVTPHPTTTASATPVLSTNAVVGTAAGGTVGIALIIGLVLLLLRCRKRRASLASSADMWEPTRNTNPKPTLPNIDNDTSFGRYSEVMAGAPKRPHSEAELHSENIPPPRPQTAYNGFPKTQPEMRSGGTETVPYYVPAQQSQLYRHGSNIESRYPEMASNAVTNMSSPISPVSNISTIQGWRATSPSNAPTIRISSADLRSEGMRSPVSELGSNVPLRSTRSAELHGADPMSPMSELGTAGSYGGGNGAAELHTESVLPPKLGSTGGGDMTAVIAEMEGSNMQKGHRHGVSTNF